MMTAMDIFMEENSFTKVAPGKYKGDQGAITWDGTAFHAEDVKYGLTSPGEAIVALNKCNFGDREALINEGFSEDAPGIWRCGKLRISISKRGTYNNAFVGETTSGAEMVERLRAFFLNKEYAITDCLKALSAKTGISMDDMYQSWGTEYLDTFNGEEGFHMFLKNKVAGRGVYVDVLKFIGKPVTYTKGK